MQQNEEKVETEAYRGSPSLLLHPRSCKRWSVSKVWEKESKKEQEGKEENRDQLQALFSCLTRLPKCKLRPEIHFSDNLKSSEHSKIQNISKFGLDMPVEKSGLKVRTNQQNVTSSCQTKRKESIWTPMAWAQDVETPSTTAWTARIRTLWSQARGSGELSWVPV